MVIGIDASRANRKHRTGTEWYSFYLIKEFAKINKEHRVILYLDDEAREDLQEIVKNNPLFIIKILRWPFTYFWTLGRLSWEMLWRPPRVLFVPAHGIPLIHPRRTINTIHDIAFIRERDLYSSQDATIKSLWQKKLINRLFRVITLGRYRCNFLDYLSWSTEFSLKKSQKIIAVSYFTKKEIIEVFAIKEKKITVIHNGFNNELYSLTNVCQEDCDRFFSENGLDGQYFLYVGRLEKKKNIPLLIEAFAEFKENNPRSNYKLVLVGSAGFHFDEIKYLIEEYNLGEDVVITGWLEEKLMPYIYSRAVAFVFPSRHEGFGIPIIQAMACGTPCLISDIPVLKEVAQDAALYFDCHSKSQIADVMKKIISKQALAQKLRQAGLLRSQEFSWQICASKTWELITHV